MKKLTGDSKEDFPELFENSVDNRDASTDINSEFYEQVQKENEFLKRNIIEEVIENVDIKRDLSVGDKRLNKTLLERFFGAIF